MRRLRLKPSSSSSQKTILCVVVVVVVVALLCVLNMGFEPMHFRIGA